MQRHIAASMAVYSENVYQQYWYRCFFVIFNALVDSSSGQETLTISAPASLVLRFVLVDFTSEVNVLVID